MSLRVVPMTLREARAFVNAHHRHHRAPQGGLFAVAVAEDEQLVGCAIVGKPIARMLDDGYTAEITRVTTLGHRNACSMIYGAARRAARALGYRRIVTYTLESESGVSLRASGFVVSARTTGGSWSRPARRRIDAHPLEPKIRWETKP